MSSGLLSVNVATSVKAPRKQHSKAVVDTTPKEEPWTHEELLRFREVADSHEWAAVWRLTLCGLRRSEIMGMTWERVDLERGEVRIEAATCYWTGVAPLPTIRSPRPHGGQSPSMRSSRAPWLCCGP
jgi:site-specific recombinase XerC